MRFGRELRDVLAHAFERAHVGVDRETVDRGAHLAAHARAGPDRERAALLALERADLLAEAQQVLLGGVGLGAQAFELLLGALELADQLVAVRDDRHRERLVAAPHRALGVAGEPRHLGAPVADLGLELVAQVEDAGDGFLQLGVALRAARGSPARRRRADSRARGRAPRA